MVLSLDGLWDFKLLEEGEIWDAKTPLCGGLAMPVPCSYNDIYPGRDFKNHMGSMVYERYADIPEMLLRERLLLRFGSVTHKAVVYLNGVEVVSHKGGFLPFEAEIQDVCHAGENRITVVVDNIVDDTTLPCGRLATERFPGLKERRVNLVNFDFFNYSGIMRPVVLYTTPKKYIRDISVNGKADGSFTYEIDTVGEGEVRVELLAGRNCCCGADSRDAGSADSKNAACCCGTEDAMLWQSTERKGTGQVENCQLWSVKEPNLYRLRVTLSGENDVDEYTEEFGFREFYVQGGKLWLNGEEIYLKGFGKHEDAVVNGRGFNEAYNVKDIALMKWMGANSFRTSHYPYSEEMMRLCDL